MTAVPAPSAAAEVSGRRAGSVSQPQLPRHASLERLGIELGQEVGQGLRLVVAGDHQRHASRRIHARMLHRTAGLRRISRRRYGPHCAPTTIVCANTSFAAARGPLPGTFRSRVPPFRPGDNAASVPVVTTEPFDQEKQNALDSSARWEKRARVLAAVVHNTKMPHPAFNGQTPDEMFFGTGAQVPEELALAKGHARAD